jgi:hypothetical protein
MPAVPDGCEGLVAGAQAQTHRRCHGHGGRTLDDVIKSTTAAGQRTSTRCELLRNCPPAAPGTKRRDGPCGAHRRPSMRLPAASPGRTVTRVTYRRRLRAPRPRRWPISANQRSDTATGINPLTTVFRRSDRRKQPAPPAGTASEPRHSRHGSNNKRQKRRRHHNEEVRICQHRRQRARRSCPGFGGPRPG